MAEDDAAGGKPEEAASIDASIPRLPRLPADARDADPGIKEVFGVPVDAFVKGGTTTSAHDNWMAAQVADAERRRNEADAERAAARDHGVHQGNPNDIASLYTNQFTDHPEVMKAYVPLLYMSRHGKDVDFYGVGDIIMAQDPAFDNELTLMLYCPRCRDHGLPADHCIIHIRQSNRSWFLDQRKAGLLFVDPDGQALRSAGTVMDGEAFTCARCSWRARIDNNRVWTL